MKKTLSILVCLLCVLGVSAQENQIKRIPKVGHDNEQQNYRTLENGFWVATELSGGASCNVDSRNLYFSELDVTFGYRFSQFFKIGVGLGPRYYFHQAGLRRSHIRWAMPLYATVRGNIMSSVYRNVVPYWGLEAGATVRDGLMFRPTIGIRFGEQRNAFTLGLSYMGQELATYNDRGEKDKKYTNFVCLRLGYEF